MQKNGVRETSIAKKKIIHTDNRQSTQRHVFRISVCIVPTTRRLARNKTVISKRQPRYAPEMNGISKHFVVFLAVMHLCVQLHAAYVCDHDEVETEEVSIRNYVSFLWGSENWNYIGL